MSHRAIKREGVRNERRPATCPVDAQSIAHRLVRKFVAIFGRFREMKCQRVSDGFDCIDNRVGKFALLQMVAYCSRNRVPKCLPTPGVHGRISHHGKLLRMGSKALQR